MAQAFSDDQLAVTTAACPDWTVYDVLRHLAGEAGCFATGDLDGAPAPEWTAKQVEARRERTVAELLDEWAGHSSAIEQRPDEDRWWLPILHDVLSHEADIAGCLGLPHPPTNDIEAAMPLIEARLPKRFAELGTVELRLDGQSRTLGAGDASVVVDTSLFEFWRGYFGRRSLRQMQSWVRSGDADAFAAAVPVFPVRSTDLVE